MTTTTATNMAAWLMKPRDPRFMVQTAPMPVLGPGEVLIRNKAVALNNIDHMTQHLAFHPVEYPAVLGQDTAGYVVSVGADVTRLKAGDRVVAHATVYRSGQPRHGAYQLYTVVSENATCLIPHEMPMEQAAVLPLGLTTAACAIFDDRGLGLRLPSYPRKESMKETLLVWGASGSIGSNAIQLAVAAGYDVFATGSAQNLDKLRTLGAIQVFESRQAEIVEIVVNALKTRDLVGTLDCVGGEVALICADVVSKVSGSRLVVTVKKVPEQVPRGVNVKHIRGDDLFDTQIGKAIWVDFLPNALNCGAFSPAPEPHVMGSGLESVQGALDLLMKGSESGKKMVVAL